MKLEFNISKTELEKSQFEFQRVRGFNFKLFGNGIIGGGLFTFFVYIVLARFAHVELFAPLVILFALFSLLITFVSYRTTKQFIESSINPKGEAIAVELEINSKHFQYKTQYTHHHLLMEHFEAWHETRGFFFLIWSAEKAHYLKELGIFTIPKRGLSRQTQEELRNIFKCIEP